MKTTKRILLDCDDVLLDWSTGFKHWMENSLGHKQVINESTHFTIGSQYNMPIDEGLKLVDDFNTSFRFGLLDPTPGARRAVERLLVDDYEIHVITACGTNPTTKINRLRNLDFCFGMRAFKSVIIVEGGQTKVPYLKDFDGCFFVDDSMSNVKAAKDESKVIPVFMENYMNRHLLWNGLRINNLMEFYDSYIAEKKYA